MDANTIIVTGGTGLVGRSIVDALDGDAVVSLSRGGADRRATAAASRLLGGAHGHRVADGPAHVRADVTRPRLGLARDEYAALAESSTAIVHCAGITDFTTPKPAVDAVNVEGTRHVIALARDAGAPLYHVSTAYVEADATAVNGRWGAGVYLASKRAAEQLVQESGLPKAIVRPSIVFGDSRTGDSPSFQGLHRLVGMMLREELPLLPFAPATRVDFLPRDVVGAVTARLVRGGFRGDFWLASGTHALTFERVVELVLEHARRHGRELRPPRFVERELLERLLKPVGGAAIARRIDVLLAVTSHFASRPLLPSSLAPAERPDLESAFLRGVDHWARVTGA
jgi:nucleoside-diphosphate-sugar epimerase